ncbi:MAG: hypothetical protein ACFHXK_18230 [bacterium]
MKKKQAESNPNSALRREALASDVERFLNSGNKIEQIPTGVSAQANFAPGKPKQAQEETKKS